MIWSFRYRTEENCYQLTNWDSYCDKDWKQLRKHYNRRKKSIIADNETHLPLMIVQWLDTQATGSIFRRLLFDAPHPIRGWSDAVGGSHQLQELMCSRAKWNASWKTSVGRSVGRMRAWFIRASSSHQEVNRRAPLGAAADVSGELIGKVG